MNSNTIENSILFSLFAYVILFIALAIFFYKFHLGVEVGHIGELDLLVDYPFWGVF